MIEYIENFPDLKQALVLWNTEMGSIYPIPEKAFANHVENWKCKKTLFAFVEKELVGFIIVKWLNDTTILHVSLFYVKKKYRRRGIGSKLFAYVEKTEGAKEIYIGKDYDNFFPGVPSDFDNLTDVWLRHRGFEGTRYTHDLIAFNPVSFPLINGNVRYERVASKDKDELISFLKDNGWERWKNECEAYFQKNHEKDAGFYITGKTGNKIVSFVKINTCFDLNVSYNVMWQERFSCLGGIGPLGVDKASRCKKLGFDMMNVAVKKLKEMKIKEIMIDWTGLMEIYRPFGFEVWKSYKYMHKIINLK